VWSDVASGLTQLTGEAFDDSDQDQAHSGSQSLSQKVRRLPVCLPT